MALTTNSFTINLNLSLSTPKFEFTDTTDYVGQGVAEADANGVFTINGPAGLIYTNTDYSSPDIDVDVDTDFETVSIPLDSDSNILNGTYTIVYSSKDDNTGDIVSTTSTITVAYEPVTVSVDVTFNFAQPLLTSTDSTSYVVGGVTPSITRTHEIIYPANLATDISGTGATVTTSTVYTKKSEALQYAGKVTSVLVYSFTGYTLEDTVTGVDYYNLQVDPSLCDVYCGMRQVAQNLANVLGTSAEPAALGKFAKVTGYAQMIRQAIDCGKGNHIEGYLEKIRECGGFTEDCGCSDDDPVLVQGLGCSGTTVVVDAGSGIDVSSASGGGTTTYTVSLDSATQEVIDNMENNTVIAGTGMSVSTATVSGVVQYTVNCTVTEPELMMTKVTLTQPSADSAPNISVSSKVYGDSTGEVLQNPTVALESNSASNWSTYPIGFNVSDFFTGSSATYYPSIEIVQITGDHEDSVKLLPNITSLGSTSFEFNLSNQNGSVITGATYGSGFSSNTVIIIIKILA